MELYAKGQLSFLILTCLQERDFYGLDIISEISNKSNGQINLKKPSVYSNLTRMEKLGYISAYLQSSDFGPNRKYYSLTESGRRFYQELKEYFDRNNIDVFKDFEENSPVQKDEPIKIMPEPLEEVKVEEVVNQDVRDEEQTDNEDFFDFSSITEENTHEIEEENIENSEREMPEESVEDDVQQEPSNIDNSGVYISENINISPVVQEEEPSIIEQQNEPQIIENEKDNNQSVDEYNKRLYDISKDINKYKRKRSFAEDQIAMAATSPLADSQIKNQANIEEFKNSLLDNKNNYAEFDFSRYSKSATASEEKKEEIKNDSVFITERYDIKDLARPKRIEPPRLKLNVTDTNKEVALPAPKRDLALDPSHKEILTRLYSKTKDGSVAEVREDALYDFDDLKQYYNKQNISFIPYKKSADKVEHNTNKLYLIVSLLSLFISAGISALIYWVLSGVGMTNVKTNFLFILLPALLVIDVIWKSYNCIRYKAWLPSQMLPQWQIWLMFLGACGLTIALNFLFGMSVETMPLFATTTILPIVLAFLLLPIRYYFKKFLIVKYWK